MITTLLLMATLAQTSGPGSSSAGFLQAMGPEHKVGAMLGRNVSIAWGVLANRQCEVVFSTDTNQLEVSCPAHIPSLSVDSLSPSSVSTNQLSAGSANITGGLVTTSLAAGSISATSVATSGLILVPQALPSCSSPVLGAIAYNSADGQHYGCGTSGWVLLSNVAAPPPIILTKTGTFTPPASLGILGIGGTSSAVVTVSGASPGQDCLVTCPASVLGKMVWQCLVATADTATVIGTSLSGVAINLPSNQTCSVRVFSTPPATLR